MYNTISKVTSKVMICLFFVGAISAGCQSVPEGAKELSPEEFEKQMQAGDQEAQVILDVRTTQEVAAGRIPGAIQIDVKSPDFGAQIDRLDPKKTYFVYCKSGVRSSKAAHEMHEKGFDKIYLLEGGMMAWEARGLPVSK